MKKRIQYSVLSVLTLTALTVFPSLTFAQSVIPGAAGFGINTVAGRGGAIHRVTNLNNSGAGSLRACMEGSGPRVCIFEISGTIRLSSDLMIRNPYLTVAGQTAPSPGIMLRGAGIVVTASDVLLQHLRVRPGDDATGSSPGNRDALLVENEVNAPIRNVVIDHCSFSWSVDELASVWKGAQDVTIMNSIFAEPLHDSIHPEGPHGFGIIFGPAYNNTNRISFIGNLTTHAESRHPFIGANNTVIANNVIYNAGNTATLFASYKDDGVGDIINGSVVNNHYIQGPAGSFPPITIRGGSIVPLRTGSQIYVAGNQAPGMTSDPWSIVNIESPIIKANIDASSAPSWPSGFTARSAANNGVYDYVLANAGARPIDRDSVDRRIIEQVRSRTGGTINCVASNGTTRCNRNAGGWPNYAVNRRVQTLPDNPNARDNQGYTNLERWLHQQARSVEAGSTTPPPPAPAPTTTVFSSADSYFGNTVNYTPLTASRWTVRDEGGNMRYALTGSFEALSGSRLGEYSLVNTRTYSDFTFQASVKSSENLGTNTGADYDVVFDYQDPSNYSYMMFSENVGGSQFFRVVNGARQNIGTAATRAAFTDNNFHTVRVVRSGTSLQAYVDGSLLLSATGTVSSGRIGIGGFNDLSSWDDITIVAPASTIFSTADAYLGNAANYTPLTASRWALPDESGNRRYALTGSFEALSGSRLGEYSLINGRTYGSFTFRASAKSIENLSTNTGADYNVVFGYVDANNYYYVMFSENVGGSQFFRVVNGARQNIGTAATRAAFTDNNFHPIRVTVSGTSLQAYVDNVLLLSATSPAAVPTGRVGIGGFNDVSSWDDITIQ